MFTAKKYSQQKPRIFVVPNNRIFFNSYLYNFNFCAISVFEMDHQRIFIILLNEIY